MTNDKETRKRQWWTTGAVLESIDGFGEPLPTFNLKGSDKVQTKVGGITTLIIIIVVILFSIVKFEHLISKYNPQMSSYFREIPFEEKVNFNDKGFHIAFSIEDYYAPSKLKNDPAYTKWYFRLYGKKDGRPFERALDAHICTEQDYAEFNPIQKISKGLL